MHACKVHSCQADPLSASGIRSDFSFPSGDKFQGTENETWSAPPGGSTRERWRHAPCRMMQSPLATRDCLSYLEIKYVVLRNGRKLKLPSPVTQGREADGTSCQHRKPWPALAVGRDSSPFAQPGCGLRVEAALSSNFSPRIAPDWRRTIDGG